MAVMGCGQIRYQSRFNTWNDSNTYYTEKYMCALRCGSDSLNYFRLQGNRCTDSLNKYYDLMYPGKREQFEKEKQSNCNCK